MLIISVKNCFVNEIIIYMVVLVRVNKTVKGDLDFLGMGINK